jgi:hypothetical protein
MTPLELCEPLFTKVCLLNRLGRQGGGVAGYDQLRLEIEEIFAEIGKAADSDPTLRIQWQKLELPMIFFVDSMISESGLTVAATWNRGRLAYDRKELAGDEKFFDLLDETLNDASDEASLRLPVLYLYRARVHWLVRRPARILAREDAGHQSTHSDRNGNGQNREALSRGIPQRGHTGSGAGACFKTRRNSDRLRGALFDRRYSRSVPFSCGVALVD